MDWKKTIIEIQEATGMSQAAVGMAVGRSQAWIADILSGRYDDVKWRDGECLRRLHSVHCQESGAGEASPEPHQEIAPVRALACATQSVRLTADRRDADRRELARRAEPVAARQPGQLPLAIEAGERYWEAE